MVREQVQIPRYGGLGLVSDRIEKTLKVLTNSSNSIFGLAWRNGIGLLWVHVGALVAKRQISFAFEVIPIILKYLE